MSSSKYPIPVERIEQKILLIRGQKVMLDSEIAMFYEVTTSNLNKAVARNIERFPVPTRAGLLSYQSTKETIPQKTRLIGGSCEQISTRH